MKNLQSSTCILLIGAFLLTASLEALAGSTASAMPKAGKTVKYPKVRHGKAKLARKDFQADILHAENIDQEAADFVMEYCAMNNTQLQKIRIRRHQWLETIEQILKQYRLPGELKYLAIVESELKAGAVSAKGAAGPWQIMPETAQFMGLDITEGIDERTDLYKSTHAAAKYLKALHRRFGDWLLVIAAYNGGPGRIAEAIRRSDSKNFWSIQYAIPGESRVHVKKYISIHYALERKGGITTRARWKNAPEVNTEGLASIGAMYIAPLSKALGFMLPSSAWLLPWNDLEVFKQTELSLYTMGCPGVKGECPQLHASTFYDFEKTISEMDRVRDDIRIPPVRTHSFSPITSLG